MSWIGNESKRVVIDNGSHMIRYGLATDSEPQSQMLNLVAQLRKTGQLIYGQDLESLLDENQIIHYIKPVIRGVLVNFDKEIMLHEKLLKNKEMEGYSLTMSYHPFAPEQVLNRMCEVAFEYFGFDAFYPVLSQNSLHQYAKYQGKANSQFSLVVESSHSATYIYPIFDNEKVEGGLRRIDIGGRLLTNQLKEIISLRAFDFKHYHLLSNQIKEDLCYVSKDFNKEIKSRKGSLLKHFILPDYDVGQKGYSVDQIDPGSMNARIDFDKERIKIPELIFRPSDIGLNQKGIVEMTKEVIQQMHPDLRGYFLENIILTGGNTLFQNFRERFYQDLRQETDQSLNINVQHISDLNAVFKGAAYQTLQPNFKELVITKQTYKENGFNNLFPIYF